MATTTFLPEELEFLAEDTIVTIIPNKSYPIFYLFSGDVGPFNPSVPTKVPLWLAVHMRKRKQCRLVPPSWLSVDSLSEMIKAESEPDPNAAPGEDDNSKLKSVPENYIAISQVILEHFTDEVPNSTDVRRLVKDLMDKRLTKIRLMIEEYFRTNQTVGAVKIGSATQMELSTVHALLTKGSDQLEMIRNPAAANRARQLLSNSLSLTTGNRSSGSGTFGMGSIASSP